MVGLYGHMHYQWSACVWTILICTTQWSACTCCLNYPHMHYPMVGLYLLSELSSYALPNGRPVPVVWNYQWSACTCCLILCTTQWSACTCCLNYPHMHYPMVGLYLLSELSSYALPNGRPVPAVWTILICTTQWSACTCCLNYPHMHYPMVGLYLLSELSSYALPNGRPVPVVWTILICNGRPVLPNGRPVPVVWTILICTTQWSACTCCLNYPHMHYPMVGLYYPHMYYPMVGLYLLSVICWSACNSSSSSFLAASCLSFSSW